MTQPWFRYHRGALHNPKIQRLPEKLFKAWVNLLCATDDDGILPAVPDLAYMTRASEKVIRGWISSLVEADLFVALDDDLFMAKDWSEHQRRSDTSTERVKRHREKKRAAAETKKGNVSCNVSRNEIGNGHNRTEQSRAETDQTTTHPISELDAARAVRDAQIQVVCGALGLPIMPKDWPRHWSGLLAKVDAWLAAGADLKAHIVPACTDMAAKGMVDDKGPAYLQAIVYRLRDEGAKAAKPIASSGVDPRAPESDLKAQARLKHFDAGTWFVEQWGPRPGEPGCLIRPDLIEAHRAKRAA